MDDARKKRKGLGVKGGDGEDEKTEKATHKLLWSLDNRVRQLEGQIPSYFLSEGDTLLLPALENANKGWEGKLKKGEKHPDGPRRTTLAAGVLNALAKADLSQASVESKEEIKFYDELAAMTKTPTVAEQQEILKKLLASYTSAQKLEPEVTVCSFFTTKKPDASGKKRYFFALEFSPLSPLRHTVEYVRICLKAAGAVQNDGPPPMGPLIREIPRHK